MSLLPVLESVTIAPKILEKMDFLQLYDLRLTCKRMNALVEKHRFHLAKKRSVEVDIRIKINAANEFIVTYFIMDYYCHYTGFDTGFDKGEGLDHGGREQEAEMGGQGEATLSNPSEQLPGLFIDTIEFDLEEKDVTTEKQAKLVRIFQEWKPCIDYLKVDDLAGFSAETISGILSSSSFRSLDLNAENMSVERILSLESVQNATYLTLHVNEDGLPAKGVLERLTKVKRVEFSCEHDEWRDGEAYAAIPQLIPESDCLTEDNHPYPSISFEWNRGRNLVNPEMTHPNLYLIYSKVTPYIEKYDGHVIQEEFDDIMENFAKKCYALNLPNRIMLFFDDYHVGVQKWRIYFVKKEKDELKKLLEEETGDPCCDRLLDHMFKKLLGKQ